MAQSFRASGRRAQTFERHHDDDLVGEFRKRQDAYDCAILLDDSQEKRIVENHFPCSAIRALEMTSAPVGSASESGLRRSTSSFVRLDNAS